ncbi:MAG: SufE family protein [Pseudomonadota bacterium]
MAGSAAFDEIAENFEFLDDWEDRYRYVIELGKAMEPLAEAEKIPEYKVEGCASQVWLVPAVSEGADGRTVLSFRGDSDAMIVRGLIALLNALYSGRPVAEIREIDAAAQFDRLGLAQHLSAQRSNGLKAMIRRLDGLAASALAA